MEEKVETNYLLTQFVDSGFKNIYDLSSINKYKYLRLLLW